MQMTPEEIVRHYTHAANKHKDIKVLAELNMVTPAEIRAVLAESGVEGIEAPKRIARRKKRLPALRRSLPKRTDRRYTGKSRTSSPPCPAIWAKRPAGLLGNCWRRCSRSIWRCGWGWRKERAMLYSDFSIDLVLKQMAEVFNKKSTPTRICSVLLEAMEIIQQLRRAAVPPPNGPLTLEELREMDGEPVWIKSDNWHCKGKWGLVSVWTGPTGDKFAVYVFDTKTGATLYPNQEYGRCWTAYRRRPEEGTK